MITTQTMPKTPVRHITAKVELYNGSTLLNTFNYNDYLKSIEIDRIAEENKLFGFTICQKAKIKVLDKQASFSISEGNRVIIYFNHGEGYISPFPELYVSEVSRDKNTNELTFSASDLMVEASKHTVNELSISSYTIYDFAFACAQLLKANGVNLANINASDSALNLFYTEGANFDGTESIRQALTAVAEATQAIIYFDNRNRLTIKRTLRGSAVDTFETSDYFSFETKGSKRVRGLAHITELGDNVEAKNSWENGETFYIRNNPFYELREDIGEILQTAVNLFERSPFALYELNARGNYLLELGDYFGIRSKAGGASGAFLLNDSIKYSGGLSQRIYFNYGNNIETPTNPATIGESLKQTSAKVDKVNRTIELLASESDIANSRLSALEVTTEGISAQVVYAQQVNDDLNNSLNDLTKRVEATLTAEEILLEIKTEIANGTGKVETATGYSFNENGLTVSKSGSEMETTITEDGMTVNKDGNAVLTANNEGVSAIDLHATTFLIVGRNSRFEDYDNHTRTACFWIGG